MLPLHLAFRMGQSSDVLFYLPLQPCFISQHLVTVSPKTRELVAQHGPSIEHVLSRKQQFTSWEQQNSMLKEFQVEAEEPSFLNDFLVLNAFLCSWHGANEREHYREKAQSGQMVDRLESGPVMVCQLKCGYRACLAVLLWGTWFAHWDTDKKKECRCSSFAMQIRKRIGTANASAYQTPACIVLVPSSSSPHGSLMRKAVRFTFSHRQ